MYTFLKERDALSLLEDNNLALATQDVRIVCPPGFFCFFFCFNPHCLRGQHSTANPRISFHAHPCSPRPACTHTHTHPPLFFLLLQTSLTDTTAEAQELVAQRASALQQLKRSAALEEGGGGAGEWGRASVVRHSRCLSEWLVGG